MKYLIVFIIAALTVIGGNFLIPDQTSYNAGGKDVGIFGSTSFPTSADSLTNPASTDSVATVSHSSQHANANDAIEAIEAKLGTGASTPSNNTIFVGNGSGSSQFSTWATSTNFNTANLFVTASSTFQNISFFNMATGTSATTTNFFATTASTTKFYSSGLASCTGSNFLQWTGGTYSCGAGPSGTITFFSTTTSVALATTTIPSANMPSTDHIRVIMTASSTEATHIWMNLNNNSTASMSSTRSLNWAAPGDTDGDSYIQLTSQTMLAEDLVRFEIIIDNYNNQYKFGSFTQAEYGTSSPTLHRATTEGSFFWKNNTGRITQIDIGNVSGLFPANTRIEVIGY